MRRVLIVLIAAVIGFSSASQAYDKDTHFYVMYTIYRDCGFDAAQAAEIATYDEYIDEHPKTEPTINPKDREQRRTFHFPSGTSWTCPNTIRNSPYGKHNVNRGFQENDTTLLGMSMHVYMDSYAHETWGPLVGHAAAGHDPDRPHLATSKFRHMVRMSYNIVRHFRAINSLPIVSPMISLDKYEEWSKYTPPSWDPIRPNFKYEQTEIAERIVKWQAHIKEFFANDITYAAPNQTQQDKAAKRRAIYGLPGKEKDCLDAEWSGRKKGDMGTVDASSASGRRGAVNMDKVVERLQKMKSEQVAKYVVSHPEVTTDERVQAIVVDAKVLDAIVKLAAKNAKPYPIWSVIAACDWSAIDFSGTVKANLSSTNLKTSLLAANLICQYPTEDALKEIGATYKKINVDELKSTDRQYLIDMLPYNSAILANFAPDALPLIAKLFDDKKLAYQASALLYAVGSDEAHADTATSGILALPGAKTAATEVRQTALERLRQGSTATLKDVPTIKLWQTRSYQDFDSAAKNSETDKANLSKLEELLKDAVSKKDFTQIQASATALATYDAEDSPAQSLIDTLIGTMTNGPTNDDVGADIGYALEELTGQSFDLTPTGLADFDHQWNQKRKTP